MITKKMQEYLMKVNPEDKKSIKHCVYMNRIQKRINRELDMMLWLAIHHPKLFLDEEKEWKSHAGKVQSHRRLKRLLLTIKALNPKMDVELVLHNLEFPDEKIDIPK
jgi:hypothetical protein